MLRCIGSRACSTGAVIPRISRGVTRIGDRRYRPRRSARLQLAIDAWQAYERMGSPEGDLALANVVVYLACAPKSNAALRSLSAKRRADVEAFGSLEVPLRLRNAPTRLMKELDYGKGYRYAHDEPDAYARGERYLPDDMPDRHYYRPVAPRTRDPHRRSATALACTGAENIELDAGRRRQCTRQSRALRSRATLARRAG
jgi:putative ATPase